MNHHRTVAQLRPGDRVVVIGAGPAGLTAAYQLSKAGVTVTVLEGDDTVGGISRTARYKNFRFDIGGHRFFTKLALVQALWREILGDDFLSVRDCRASTTTASSSTIPSEPATRFERSARGTRR